MKLLFLAAWAASTIVVAAPSDTPQDYTHALPLSANAKQGVLQLRLPKDVYLHARSPMLDDVRVFDAKGIAQPFALRTPAFEARTSHRDLPLSIFPLMANSERASQLDLDVSTASDGRLLSVKVRPEAGGQPQATASRLSALILDLGKEPAPINALRFTLPPGQQEYSAQVWLETSSDMKHWDTVGAAELNWLVNQNAQTLANDHLDFDTRTFRYARLSWRSGTPLQFASIAAEQPVRSDATPPGEQLLLQPSLGREPKDLVYAVPPAIAPLKVGLQFTDANVVLAGALGVYRELPARQVGQGPAWRFDALVSSTFYRITQNDQVRSSGDLDVPTAHATQWVLRTAAPTPLRPALRLNWQPATLVFLASGNGPYTLVAGRERAVPAAQSIAQVAPGFSEAELLKLEAVTAGPAAQQQGSGAQDAGAALEAGTARLIACAAVLIDGSGTGA
jgi:hypothetical protein